MSANATSRRAPGRRPRPLPGLRLLAAALLSLCILASLGAAPLAQARAPRHHRACAARRHRRARCRRHRRIHARNRPARRMRHPAPAAAGSPPAAGAASAAAVSASLSKQAPGGLGATASLDPLASVGVAPAGAPSAADPSGVPMPQGNLPGWRQVFSDDFTTDVPLGGFSGCRWNGDLMSSDCSGLPASVAAKWWAYPDGWPDTSHNGQYYPSQTLSIHNGMMDIYLHTADGIHMVAAPEPKIPGGPNGFGLQYGAYVVRFKADALPGYKLAWLLWPDSEIWPSDGEIDFPEGELTSTFSGFMHWMGATSGSQQDVYPTTAGAQQWHTATIEWTPSYCRFILDGQVIGTSTQRIPSDPMHWVLQTETSVDGTPPADATAGHVLIDWVAAYAYAPGTA